MTPQELRRRDEKTASGNFENFGPAKDSSTNKKKQPQYNKGASAAIKKAARKSSRGR